MVSIMKSKKPDCNFNEYFPWMWEEAQRQGLNKGPWFAKSGHINQNRWIEFARASKMEHSEGVSRDVSADYFLRLTRGLGLKPSQVEKKTGKKFSKKQLKRMQRQAWVDANEDLIDMMMDATVEKQEMARVLFKK